MFTVRVIGQSNQDDLPTVDDDTIFIERGMQVLHIEVKEGGVIQVTLEDEFSLGDDFASKVKDWVRPKTVVRTTKED